MLMSFSVLLIFSSCVCAFTCTNDTHTHAPAEQQGGSSPNMGASRSSKRQQDASKHRREDNEVPTSFRTMQIRGGIPKSAASAPSAFPGAKNTPGSNLHSTADPNAASIPQSPTLNPSTIFQEVSDGPLRLSRSRRSWIWNQFFVIEEYSGPEPVLIGRLRSSLDRGDGRVLYVLSGEGAGSVFVIDGQTGNIHVTKPLDREQKEQYRLVATATDRRTGHALEASSQFTIRVQDINDNPPTFSHMHYSASVPERANAGTSVIQVTATDADDKSYGNSAKLVYSIIQGQQYFTVDPYSGVVRTAVSDMDRELQSQYMMVLEARDMAGHQGGLTGTATITVTLSDVNDNPPRFTQRLWVFSVSELALPGAEVGRVSATDADMGENAQLEYTISDGDGRGKFNISGLNQQGVITLSQPLDYETQSSYTVSVEVQNPSVDLRFLRSGVIKDEAVVRITVLNADEPPKFTQARYHLKISENCRVPCTVGRVTAADPDTGLSTNIEYSVDPTSDPDAVFRISPVSGLITAVMELDREQEQWHNISIIATQRDSPNQVARVVVAIETLDVNDNPPELDGQYQTAVCDSRPAGQVVQVIRAVDRDQISSGSPVHFSLSPDSSLSLNFSIHAKGDHTANLLILSSLKPLPHSASTSLPSLKIPIILRDGASELSSTGMVTVILCPCESGGMWVEEKKKSSDGKKSDDGEELMEWERRMVCSSSPASYMLLGFSSAAMLAILASSSILMVVVVFSLSMRKKKTDPLSPVEYDEIRENIITYDDEGGGEEDTVAFDITALKSVPHAIHTRGVGPNPLYGPLCYSIHTLSDSPYGQLRSRLDWNKPAHTLPHGYTLNSGHLDPGSTLTEVCSKTEQKKISEESRGSTESVPMENQPEGGATTGTESQDETPLVQGDCTQSADPPDITPPNGATKAERKTDGLNVAPFRTMEGTLLTGTTVLYPSTAQEYTQSLVGTYAGSRGPELSHGTNLVTLRIGELLQHRLDQVTFDPMQPPYDSLRMYEYEGAESETVSLSSIESGADGGLDVEMVSEWGPKFVKLLEIFGRRGEQKEVINQEENGS